MSAAIDLHMGPDSVYYISDSSDQLCYSGYHLRDSSYPPVIAVILQLLRYK